MLKNTLLVAAALTSVSAFAQDGMMDVDAKSSRPAELMSFINKDAYKKLSAPDAYALVSFLGDLPGNYQTAVLRGLALNAQEAREAKMRNQMSANMMAPMGDRMMDDWKPMDADPKMTRSYMDSVGILQKDQDATDQGLIANLFRMKPFTEDPLMSPCHERELDAITKYLNANAKSAEPIRLKYTSLAPRTYVSPVIPR